MVEQYSIVYMYHISFIHSSVNGHLGGFYVLAIVNSAAMNTGYMYLFKLYLLSFFSRYMSGSGMVAPFLVS